MKRKRCSYTMRGSAGVLILVPIAMLAGKVELNLFGMFRLELFGPAPLLHYPIWNS